MKNGLFHAAIGFPAGATDPWLGSVRLEHTGHSKNQCLRPECRKWVKGGVINIAEGEQLEVDAASIIEVEVANGVPVKALVRLEYDDNSDICFALCAPSQGHPRCKTLWTLSANDHHRSTDLSKYNKP